MPVNGVGGINVVSSPITVGLDKVQGDGNSSISFGDYFKNALDKVNDLQNQADQANDDFAAGRTDDIHSVMIASEKADIALQFTMQIRNKIMDAYSEIMRMQI